MSLSNSGRLHLGVQRRGVRLQADGPGGGGATFNGNPYSFYSLLDIFADPRAAGAVNGTLPVVGGARVVVDTNLKLSITGGALSFATGGVGGGDPAIWYASQARAFGRVLVSSITMVADTAYRIGWDTNQTGGLIDDIRFIASGVLTVSVNAATFPAVGVYSLSTSYQVALIMRATGMYYFIKGGAFTNWTLLWQSSLGNAAMFPSATANSATSVFTIDNPRVPLSALYAVPQLAYDTFTRANGALGSTEAAGSDAQVITARAWTLQAGTIVISSNAASLTVLSGALNAIATVDVGTPDVLIDVAVTRTLGSGGSVMRYVDANNYLRATTDGTNCLIEQVVAGTPTTLRTGAVTYTAGKVPRVQLKGTTGRLFYDGLVVGASFTVPVSGATLHGLYGADLSCLWDNFQCLAYDTGYDSLDSF